MIKQLIALGFILVIVSLKPAHASLDDGTLEAKFITIKASRFVFSPSQIVIKKGQTVVLELESSDGLHGFTIPELNVRADIESGKKVAVKITPSQKGRFIFYCDIFCGSGHEEMSGVIVCYVSRYLREYVPPYSR